MINTFIKTNFTQEKNEMYNEINGILEGMKGANIDIFLKQLNRSMNVYDLYALNAYIEVEYFTTRGINPNKKKIP